jgi:hypothetical protein
MNKLNKIKKKKSFCVFFTSNLKYRNKNVSGPVSVQIDKKIIKRNQ